MSLFGGMKPDEARQHAREIEGKYGLVCPHCETVLTFLFRGAFPEELRKCLRDKMVAGEARLSALEGVEDGLREGTIRPTKFGQDPSPGDAERH